MILNICSSVIKRNQFLKENRSSPSIFLSKDRRKVRLFCYDRRSYRLYEKRFALGYKFMKVCRGGDESTVYSIEWCDVVVLNVSICRPAERTGKESVGLV